MLYRCIYEFFRHKYREINQYRKSHLCICFIDSTNDLRDNRFDMLLCVSQKSLVEER